MYIDLDLPDGVVCDHVSLVPFQVRERVLVRRWPTRTSLAAGHPCCCTHHHTTTASQGMPQHECLTCDAWPCKVPTQAQTHHRVYLDGELIADLHGPTKHNEALPPVAVGRAGRKVRRGKGGGAG